jgi:hypothetical protein
MEKIKHTKSSKVEAGAAPGLPKEFVRITQSSVHVKHQNSGGATVYKTYLLKAGGDAIKYQLDEGDSNVQPGDYDHAAAYAGPAGHHIFSILEYD